MTPSEMSVSTRPSPGWTELWFEPWTGAHPSWLDTAAGAPEWPRLPATSAAGRRLTYWLFCHYLEWPSVAPAALCPARIQDLDGLAMDQETMPRVALFLGMLTWASTEGFVATWTRDRAMLPVAPLAQWRSALRLARARPLPPSGPSTPHPRTALDLTILGMGQMRAAAEALQPGLWLRLRLRWDCALIAAHEHLAGTTPAPVSDAAVRHIIRAWRAAGVHRGAVATHTLPDIGTPHGTN